MKTGLALGVLTLIAACSFPVYAQEADSKVDNGTDPTKISRIAALSWEYIDLGAGSQDTFKATYQTPITEDGKTGLRIQLPLVHNDALGNGGYGMGDVGVRFNHVAKFTRAYGLVVTGELLLDTASKPEYGTGQNVFKGTLIYAKFLKGGAIFAPALVQSNSLWGDDARADINNTVLDLYYVPKFSNPKVFMTVDPALNLNWETDAQFVSLAVTVGRVLGPTWGGNSQVYLKPSAALGNERSADWGIEAGFKVIGF